MVIMATSKQEAIRIKRRDFLRIAERAAVFTAVVADARAEPQDSRHFPERSGKLQGPRGISGWRARIGILYPEDGALDDEYFRMAPPGVTVHVTRLGEEVKCEVESVQQACSLYRMINPDCVTYSSNSGSLWNGVGTDEELMAKMRKGISCPVSTAATAMMRAFQKLGINRIAIASPYWKEINVLLADFLRRSNINVVSLIGPELQSGEAIFSFPPQELYRWAVATDRPEAQAIYLPCTNLRTLEVIEPLEADLKKPVISANQALMWDALHLAGIRQQREGFGRLFKIS